MNYHDPKGIGVLRHFYKNQCKKKKLKRKLEELSKAVLKFYSYLELKRVNCHNPFRVVAYNMNYNVRVD